VVALVVIAVVVVSERRGRSGSSAVSTTYSVDATRVPGRTEVPDLLRTETALTRQALGESGVFKRGQLKRKHLRTAADTKEILEVDTGLLKAQAEQVKTVIREQNEIDELVEDGELGPLRKKKKESALKAAIATNELTEAEQRKKKEDLYKEPPVPLAPPAQATPKPPLTTEQKAAIIYREFNATSEEIQNSNASDADKETLIAVATRKKDAALRRLYG
jgi:hypothetical protein